VLLFALLWLFYLVYCCAVFASLGYNSVADIFGIELILMFVLLFTFVLFGFLLCGFCGVFLCGLGSYCVCAVLRCFCVVWILRFCCDLM